MEVLEVAPGLWRWTALHPDWTPGGDWRQEVACVYWDGGDTLCLVDPLVPAEDEERFFRALDGDVERVAKPVAIILTTADHERSAGELRTRYDAAVWARHADRERIDAPVDAVFGAGERLPGGFDALEAGRPEALLWLEARRTLVCGDVLVGGPLRVSPWAADADEQRRTLAALRRTAALPVETVLVGHGEPVLAGGAAALEQAIADATD